MKKIFSILLIGSLSLSTMLFTACIDEVEPTDGATQEQIDKSISAKAASLWSSAAFENVYEVATDQHFDWGLGSIMHIRDVLTEDLAVASSNYDHYSRWGRNQYLGKDYVYAGFPWIFYCKWVQTANKAIASIDEETAGDVEKGYLGSAYAFRALIYLDMARMYEYLPCKATSNINSDGNDVLGLTVPIVTEKTTEEEAKNNPRASHNRMFKFIQSDLDKAEELIPYLTINNPVIPTLPVVYGLKARLYMWNASYQEEIGSTELKKVPAVEEEALSSEFDDNLTEEEKDPLKQYSQAQNYAHLAIEEGGYTPVSKDEWFNITTGFNTPTDAWMLASQQVKENDVVQSGILNWTSWMCNETAYG